MDNLERLKMELKEYDFTEIENQLITYLQENGLNDSDEYNATSNSNKRAIYMTAVSFLESIANSPSSMKNYKTEDITISMFHKNLMNQIDYLNRKIRMMPTDDNDFGDGRATVGYLFTE